jgi:hypothetical protein
LTAVKARARDGAESLGIGSQEFPMLNYLGDHFLYIVFAGQAVFAATAAFVCISDAMLERRTQAH